MKVAAEPIFLLLYLSFTSELWLRPWEWSNCWVSPEFLLDLKPLKNEVKWQVGGLPSTTALCAELRKLFLIRFRLSFYFSWRGCSERDKFKLQHLCEKFYMKNWKKTVFLNCYLKNKKIFLWKKFLFGRKLFQEKKLKNFFFTFGAQKSRRIVVPAPKRPMPKRPHIKVVDRYAEFLRKNFANKLYLPKQMGKDQLHDLHGPILLQ